MASYLLSTSELLEEMLDVSRSKITKNIDAGFSEAFGFGALAPVQCVIVFLKVSLIILFFLL